MSMRRDGWRAYVGEPVLNRTLECCDMSVTNMSPASRICTEWVRETPDVYRLTGEEIRTLALSGAS